MTAEGDHIRRGIVADQDRKDMLLIEIMKESSGDRLVRSLLLNRDQGIKAVDLQNHFQNHNLDDKINKIINYEQI